tara:strand:- start:1483 stop:2964 length:1482 start_codon:yes stop_codon:yes gene_type:complete
MDKGTYNALLKRACEEGHLNFQKTFFKERENEQFITMPHHRLLSQTLDRVLSGEITRLVINIPPGYTKTESAVIALIAMGLAVNPKAKFIHSSYSDGLVKMNSSAIKSVINTPLYQELWPMTFRKDTKAKGEWYNTLGGGLKCAPLGGEITGFRAGRLTPGFSGAIIVDDGLKPKDAYSETKRNTANNAIPDTLKSRVAHEGIPIIIIMQRLHEEDLSGYLLKGGTGEHWHHLLIPAEIPPDFVYPAKDYPYGIPIETNLPVGATWPYKKTLENLAIMRESNPYTTASQYDQRPAPLGGGIFKDKWWQYYPAQLPPPFEYRFITADTAQKTEEKHDYSVFMCCGVKAGRLYILDVCRGKWEAPELKIMFKDFWHKHKHLSSTTGANRGAYVEDKASGTGLIQEVRDEANMPIEAIQRGTDKVTRAMDVVNYIASGYVYLPDEADWLYDFKDECRKFTPMFTHKNDDQIDTLIDAINIGIGVNGEESGFIDLGL